MLEFRLQAACRLLAQSEAERRWSSAFRRPAGYWRNPKLKDVYRLKPELPGWSLAFRRTAGHWHNPKPRDVHRLKPELQQ